MTEDEAKERWCPQAANRVVHHAPGFSAWVDEGAAIPTTTCIGSECMAWRWSGDRYSGEWDGYCGLAGKPS